MGEPKFSRPKYDTPSHPWKADQSRKNMPFGAITDSKNMKEIEGQVPTPTTPTTSHAPDRITDTTEGHGKREMEDLLRS